MLTNESGYVFLVYNDMMDLCGIFHRIEIALESIRMSLNARGPAVPHYVIQPHTTHSTVQIFQATTYRGTIVKFPTNSIPVGMVRL